MTNSQRLIELRRELSTLRSKIADIEIEMVEIALSIQKEEMEQELKAIANQEKES